MIALQRQTLPLAGHLLSSSGVLLPNLVRELNGLLEESRRITLGLTGQPLRSAQQHQAIADAILAGDAAAARRAASLHVAAVRLWLQRMTASDTPAS